MTGAVGWFGLMVACQQTPGLGTGTSPTLLNLVFETQYGDEQPVLSGHGQFIALFLMATLGAEVRHLSISANSNIIAFEANAMGQ